MITALAVTVDEIYREKNLFGRPLKNAFLVLNTEETENILIFFTLAKIVKTENAEAGGIFERFFSTGLN
jgi:hypothetical protein